MTAIKFKTIRALYDFSTDGRFNDNPAFRFVDGDGYTYKTFKLKCDEVSSLLERYGIKADEKVAILSQNMPNWPVSFFSTAAFGKIAVPLLPDFSSTEIENILEHSESKAIFVSKRLYPKLTDKSKERLDLIIEINNFDVLKGEIMDTPAHSIQPNELDLASIIYTSGTTGNSKGVMLSHKNLCANLYAAQILRPGYYWDVWLSILPLSHTLENSLCMLLPMASGSSVQYIEKVPTPNVLMAALKKVRPTTMLSVPLIMEKIYRATVLPTFTKKEFLAKIYKKEWGRKLLNRIAGMSLKKKFGGRIRFFGIGGAKLDTEVERFLLEAKFPYAIGYGLTETSPLIAGATPDIVRLQSTGPVVYGVEARIDDPNPETGEGEIVVKGDNVMMGYYKNHQATEDAFTSDGWLRTKDLGVFDKDGWLYIRGRANNMIVGPSGENIYPEDIESVINNYDIVNESIVTQDKGRLIALVHLNPAMLEPIEETQDKLSKDMHTERVKLIDWYKEKIEEFSKSYDGKMEEFKNAYDAKRKELYDDFAKKRDEITESYNKMKEDAARIYHEKVDQIKKDLTEFVNSKVNKSSKISSVDIQDKQFEKTATQKIKRYLYTGKKKDEK